LKWRIQNRSKTIVHHAMCGVEDEARSAQVNGVEETVAHAATVTIDVVATSV
jgi:hypothetical protein